VPLPLGYVAILVPALGVEPGPYAYQAHVLAIKLSGHECGAPSQNRTETSSLRERRAATITNGAWSLGSESNAELRAYETHAMAASRARVAFPGGLEPPTPRFVIWCSVQLSYGNML
jgi:hypothetical protein